MSKFQNLTGQKFGRLTVIERAENKGKNTMWLCRCDCGNKTYVRIIDEQKIKALDMIDLE